MAATHTCCTKPQPRGLHLAFELGWSEWKLACGTAAADNPRLRTLRARKMAPRP